MKKEDIDLAQYRLKKAQDTLQDAKVLFGLGRLTSAMNRTYYSIFYAARALNATKGFDSSKHSGVISFFNREFVKTGIVEKEYGAILTDSFKTRRKGDYEDYYEVKKEMLERFLKDAERFIERIGEIIPS